MSKLEVYLPFPKAVISQRFGENATAIYAAQGLKGHSAYDFVVPYGTPIPNCVENAYCYSVMHKDDPTLMDYRAVFTLVEPGDGYVYEISYGHVSKILAEVGKTYQVGDILAEVGNTGPCFVGQHEVTEVEKEAGSHAGAHLHGPQIRICEKTKKRDDEKYIDYIYDANGFYKTKDKCYLGIINYNNGYNGCVSLKEYSTEILATDFKNGTVTSTPVQPPTSPVEPTPEQIRQIGVLQQMVLNLTQLVNAWVLRKK